MSRTNNDEPLSDKEAAALGVDSRTYEPKKNSFMKTPSRKTKECFIGPMWDYRHDDFDKWLPNIQPEREGNVTVHKLQKEMTFREMAVHFFGTDDVETIKKHTLTLPMAEEIFATRKDELQVNGYGNFFFVENADGSVSVGYVHRDHLGWYAYDYDLADSNRWDADCRLVICNLDSSTLQALDTNPDSLEARIEKLEAFYERAVELIPSLGGLDEQ